MESKERFKGLSLDEMCEVVADKLAQEREECRRDAEIKLGELFDKKGTLEDEKDKLLVSAAFERVASMTEDQIEKFDIHEDSLEGSGSGKLIMRLNVKFECPQRVREIDERISEINGEIAVTKNQAVMDLNNDALNAKDRDVAFLARRMINRTRELERRCSCGSKA